MTISMPPGTAQHTELDGQPVVLIATRPHGWPAILSPAGWKLLCAWKLTTLAVIGGHVRATGKGYSGLPLVGRLFTNTTSPNFSVTHRNGNPLDLRERNLVVVPRSAKNRGNRRTKPRTTDNDQSTNGQCPRGS